MEAFLRKPLRSAGLPPEGEKPDRTLQVLLVLFTILIIVAMIKHWLS